MIYLAALYFLMFNVFLSLKEASIFYRLPLEKTQPFLTWFKIVWWPKDWWHWMKNLALYSLMLSTAFFVLAVQEQVLFVVFPVVLGVATYWFHPYQKLLRYWKKEDWRGYDVLDDDDVVKNKMVERLTLIFLLVIVLGIVDLVCQLIK